MSHVFNGSHYVCNSVLKTKCFTRNVKWSVIIITGIVDTVNKLLGYTQDGIKKSLKISKG